MRELRIDENSYIIILTYTGEYDELAVRKVINSKAAYIGMIASRSKAKTILAKLQRDKIPDELIRRSHNSDRIRYRRRDPGRSRSEHHGSDYYVQEKSDRKNPFNSRTGNKWN